MWLVLAEKVNAVFLYPYLLPCLSNQVSFVIWQSPRSSSPPPPTSAPWKFSAKLTSQNGKRCRVRRSWRRDVDLLAKLCCQLVLSKFGKKKKQVEFPLRSLLFCLSPLPLRIPFISQQKVNFLRRCLTVSSWPNKGGSRATPNATSISFHFYTIVI